MEKTAYINGQIYMDGSFVPGGFLVSEGKFAKVWKDADGGAKWEAAADSTVDLNGATVIPGLVDIHIHGAAGADASGKNPEDVIRMAEYLCSRGVTSFLPTTMTLSEEGYALAGQAFGEVAKIPQEGRLGRIPGYRMEGPFLSPYKKGSHNEANLRLPEEKLFAACNARPDMPVRILDMAPELSGALDWISAHKEHTVISAGHSTAAYEVAKAAFAAGAKHVTHLYNAMPPLHHREPGLIAAAAENSGVTTEIIADGIHVHESMVRLAFRVFPGRICLISDALACMGLPDGEYSLAGKQIRKKNGVATLQDGTLAGSVTGLYECMRRAVSFGIPKEEAVLAATATPAAVIGDKRIGAIEEGRFADYIICNGELERESVFFAGVRVPVSCGLNRKRI